MPAPIRRQIASRHPGCDRHSLVSPRHPRIPHTLTVHLSIIIFLHFAIAIHSHSLLPTAAYGHSGVRYARTAVMLSA